MKLIIWERKGILNVRRNDIGNQTRVMYSMVYRENRTCVKAITSKQRKPLIWFELPADRHPPITSQTR